MAAQAERSPLPRWGRFWRRCRRPQGSCSTAISKTSRGAIPGILGRPVGLALGPRGLALGSFVGQQALLGEGVEQRQRGQDDDRGDDEHQHHGLQRAVGCGSLSDRQAGREQKGPLRNPPRDDDGRDGPDREDAGPAVVPADQQGQRADAADGRDDDERQSA